MKKMSYNIETLILNWARDRNILRNGTIEGQMLKLHEEVSELEEAIAKKDVKEIADAIGDIQVVLTILAYLNGMSAYNCTVDAYGVIAKRTGKMVDGQFQKDEE
jgi:NTP pyrophosphatase (non-canonical NTP hydrolase)